MMWPLLALVHSYSSASLSRLPRVTQLVSSRAGIPALCFHYSMLRLQVQANQNTRTGLNISSKCSKLKNQLEGERKKNTSQLNTTKRKLSETQPFIWKVEGWTGRRMDERMKGRKKEGSKGPGEQKDIELRVENVQGNMAAEQAKTSPATAPLTLCSTRMGCLWHDLREVCP